LALIRLANHDLEGAEVSAREAVRLAEWYLEKAKDPKAKADVANWYVDCLWALAQVVEARASRSDLLATYTRITKLTDDHLAQVASEALARGEQWFAQGQFEESQKSYVQYIRLRPTEPGGWHRYALALGRAGDVARARQASGGLRLFDPANADAIDRWLASLGR
jgi:hypothetical protein